MPPKSKINKQDILTSSLEIIRKSGFEEVNARSIAKEMNCSTNPIFRVYKNMDELKEELIEDINTIENLQIFMLMKMMNCIALAMPISNLQEKKKICSKLFIFQILVVKERYHK